MNSASGPTVAAKIDHAVSGSGDDAGRWFLVSVVADPWLLECHANVILRVDVHSFDLPVTQQQAEPGIKNAGLRRGVP